MKLGKLALSIGKLLIKAGVKVLKEEAIDEAAKAVAKRRDKLGI